MLRVERHPVRSLPDYDGLLAVSPAAMMTHSPEWLDMLGEVTGAEVQLIAAWDSDGLVGVLPYVISPDQGEGRVINSLPFFGSHGGPVCRPGLDGSDVLEALAGEFDQVARESGCRSATFILTPVETRLEDLRRILRPDAEDWRLGQIAPLPGDPERILPDLVEGKRRNNIRNAQRKGVTVRERCDDEALDWLRAMHERGIGGRGGLTKPEAFFAWAARSARSGGMCSFLFAEKDDCIAAGMLVARFGDCWEYLVPAMDAAVQDSNALSLLVYEGMRRAAGAGAARWNFGGTWDTQEGVHRFKRQFGAEDRPYHYLIRIYDPALAEMTRARLSEAFPFFYSLPFRMCAS